MIDCKRFLRNFGKKILFELKKYYCCITVYALDKIIIRIYITDIFNRNPRTGENIYAADYNKRIPP